MPNKPALENSPARPSVPFWGRVGRRFGLRQLFRAGYLATSVLSLLVFAFSDSPIMASGLLVFSALGASVLDGGGNVLFLRAVRAFEQSEMAAVFANAGVWMLIAAWFCRYVPKNMR